jgi:hypothetical protein
MYLFIAIVIISIVFGVIVYKHSRLTSIKMWKRVNYDLHTNLLNLLDRTIHKLELNGITPFLIFGALLGSIRDGNLIPWDDDIDIGVYHERGGADALVSKIKAIVACDDGMEECDESDYTTDEGFGLKIHDKINHCFIDVFLMSNISPDKIHYTDPVSRNKWSDKYILSNELSNMGACSIRGVKYKCPSNTVNALKRMYGKDSIDTPRISGVHLLNDKVGKIDKFLISAFNILGINKMR